MSAPTAATGQADLARTALQVESLASDLRAAVADVAYHATYAGPTAPSTRTAQDELGQVLRDLREALDRIDGGAL